MEICLIVAHDRNRVIGYRNQLPWHLPADLKYVKQLTLDYPIIMGRKNFESIKRPLPRRRNIVLSKTVQEIEGCEVYDSVEAVLHACQLESKVFIFGGTEIYRQFLPFVDTLYITLVHQEFRGDTVFPKLDFGEWLLSSKIEGKVDQNNPHPHTFYTYKRLKNKKKRNAIWRCELNPE